MVKTYLHESPAVQRILTTACIIFCDRHDSHVFPNGIGTRGEGQDIRVSCRQAHDADLSLTHDPNHNFYGGSETESVHSDNYGGSDM